MRIKAINYGIAVLAGLAAFTACNQRSDTKDTSYQTATADTMAYEYRTYTKYSKNLIKTAETTDTAFFTVSYPEFADSAVNRFILTSLLGDDTATVAHTAQVFIGEFDNFHKSDPFPRIWTSESHAKVYQLTPSYLGLAINVSTYTGGAHGNYATVFRHYDIANRRTFTLDDVVTKQYQNELNAVAERYFRKQENLRVNEALEDRYFFDQGRFSLPDNFALEQDSILFLYNIYEIKPYVDGQTELRVPYSDIERLLTDRATHIVSELNK
ncbi:DUF3298 domain-containing protein [Parapedobacter deserti]|uniref:DUF3298 domain-containing protein n=1 Tax=Parapedobacter deserti TaxID=1912957 RepID=A0ABV7JN58_9SPHI